MGSCCSAAGHATEGRGGNVEGASPTSAGVVQARRMSSGDDDFMSCREDFSMTSGSLPSMPCSPPGTPLRMSSAGRGGGASAPQAEVSVPVTDDSVEGDASLYEESLHRGGGCMGLLEALSEKLHIGQDEVVHQPSHRKPRSRRRQGDVIAGKPEAGASLEACLREIRVSSPISHSLLLPCTCHGQRRDMSQPLPGIRLAYEDVDGSGFKIRGLDYMKSKIKVNSVSSIYRLARADMFTFDRKQNHVAQMVNIPEGLAPPLKHKITPDLYFPPLLIINLQLPTYAPTFFGGSGNGPGWSVVYYFTLNEDFDPETFPNKKALGLFKRFVQNGKEADGELTRDRFKIIPRVVNVSEWAEKGPLSMSEHKLLCNYNEKPILARPQHLYFNGPNYLEVDLDIHTYTYIARTALLSFTSRLASVIWEVAFVIQGNAADELPEQVLACARIYRTDFAEQRAYTSFIPRPVASEGGAERVESADELRER